MSLSMSMFANSKDYHDALIAYERNKTDELIKIIQAIKDVNTGWDEIPPDIHAKIDDALRLAEKYGEEP